MIDAKTVLVNRICRSCRGEGQIDRPLCQHCQQPIADDDPWWTSDLTTLPCGHLSDNYLAEKAECPECHGSGRVVRKVTGAEWRSVRRKKAVRGMFLLILGLIPFILLSVAVLTNQQGFCGGWWYGLVLAGLTLGKLT